jgi:TRAP-type uncharacterized transport system substrate-binding protein
VTTDVSRRNIMLTEQISAEAAHHRIKLARTVEEYGSLEALRELDSGGEANLALVVGGATDRDYPHVRSVTTLTQEHLHLLVKPELADKGVAGLRGKRIFLGPPATASHHIARDVLDFVGLRPAAEGKSGGYITDTTSREQALLNLTRIRALKGEARAEAIAQLPDAVLFLAPLPSPFARPLVMDFGYRLVPLPFAEAYALDHLNPSAEAGIRIDREMFTTGSIPAYTYRGTSPDITRACPTICAPLVLVARDDVEPEAIALLLETIYEGPVKNAIRPTPLNEQVRPFPRHAGTERYLHRHDPLLTPEVAARLGTVAGGIGAFVSGAIAFYGFLRLRSLYRFESYYREIGEIEMIACGLQEGTAAPTDPELRRVYLEGKLTALKCKVLEDFANGGLTGEVLMASLIALINDTRGSLAGLATARAGTQQDPVAAQTEAPTPQAPDGNEKGRGSRRRK